jgi:hypothetical protein
LVDKKRSPSRRKRIVWVALAILVLALVALAVAWVLTSPSSELLPEPVVEKPIPASWAAPSEDTPAAVEDSSWTSVGTLALVADGRAFGDESYRLDVLQDGARLASTGRFWFRVVVANVTIAFRQEWTGTARLEPITFSLHVDAPLGRGYEVKATFADRAFVVERGGATTEIPVDSDRVVVLGMFSTYALIPAQFAQREQDGVAVFDALLFGGPPGADASLGNALLPTLVVERAGDESVVVADRTVSLDRYRVSSPYGDSLLYAKGKEFLAFVAGTSERPLVVYRSDYFRDGFPLATTER